MTFPGKKLSFQEHMDLNSSNHLLYFLFAWNLGSRFPCQQIEDFEKKQKDQLNNC